MPEGRSPATPVFMGAVGVEDKPAPLHLCVSQRGAAVTGHLSRIERQVHMLGGIAVQVVDFKRTVARRKIACRISVGATLRPVAAIASRSLEAARRTDSALVLRAVTPTLVT